MRKYWNKYILTLLLLLLPTIGTSSAYFSSEDYLEVTNISSGTWYVAPQVIINEVMWMGSTISEKDEWIELKNTTDKDIDISNWRIEGAVAGKNGHLEIPHGYSIPANGYFLIANKQEGNKESALNVDVDLRSTNINLDDSYKKKGILVLRNSSKEEIDSINYQEWPAGINETTKHSMQRYLNPEEGWYTCIDLSCSDEKYWNDTTMNFGTPGGENL